LPSRLAASHHANDLFVYRLAAFIAATTTLASALLLPVRAAAVSAAQQPRDHRARPGKFVWADLFTTDPGRRPSSTPPVSADDQLDYAKRQNYTVVQQWQPAGGGLVTARLEHETGLPLDRLHRGHGHRIDVKS